MSVSEIIMVARRRAKLSQREMAAAMGVHQTWVSQVETGRIGVTLAQLAKIRALLAMPDSDVIAVITAAGEAEKVAA